MIKGLYQSWNVYFTANAELLKLRPLLQEQQLICIKATYLNSELFGSYPKSGIFNKL